MQKALTKENLYKIPQRYHYAPKTILWLIAYFYTTQTLKKHQYKVGIYFFQKSKFSSYLVAAAVLVLKPLSHLKLSGWPDYHQLL